MVKQSPKTWQRLRVGDVQPGDSYQKEPRTAVQSFASDPKKPIIRTLFLIQPFSLSGPTRTFGVILFPCFFVSR